MKFLVAPVSTMASVDDSSIVSIIFRWIGSMMHFGPSLREWMTSLHFINFSHLGQRSLQGLVGGSVDISEDSCASSSTFSSATSRTENQLLFSNGCMAHPLWNTKSSMLTRGSTSSGDSMYATSLVANLFSSSLSNLSVSMCQTLKQRSHSFIQCLVFPQYQHVSGVALVFCATSMSIGMGLSGDELE